MHRRIIQTYYEVEIELTRRRHAVLRLTLCFSARQSSAFACNVVYNTLYYILPVHPVPPALPPARELTAWPGRN